MIFVDSNIPMYLVGAAHPNKEAATKRLEVAIEGLQRLVTDVEVLQEILHRYTSIGRREAIQPTFDVLLRLVDEVFAVDLATVQRAKELVSTFQQLSARDALHVAIMEQHEIDQILTFDSGFDLVPGVIRIH